MKTFFYTILLALITFSCKKEVSSGNIVATLPTLTTTPVTSITSTTSTSGGNITDDGGAAIAARGVCWSTSPNPVVTGNHTTDGTGNGAFTSNVTGLTATTSYYVRAYATNSEGTAYGNEISFMTTNTTTALPTVSTKLISAVTMTTASGGGNVVADGGTTVTARGVCWSTTANPTIAFSTKTTDGTGTGFFTSAITGLTAATTYHVRAYATNSAGTSYGGDSIFSTVALDTAVVNGFIYVSGIDNSGGNFIYKINTTTKAVVWSTLSTVPGDITYDTTSIYKGDYNYISSYNAATGQKNWTFSWIAFNNTLAFTRYAVNNNAVFVVSPTTAYGASNLYCLNKTTGQQMWKVLIDSSGWGSGAFSCEPILYNGKIITLLRDASGYLKLTAFNVSDGSLAWQSANDNNLIGRMRLVGSRIYFVGTVASCYDAANGNFIWNRDLQFTFFGGYGYPYAIDQGKLFVAGRAGTNITGVKQLDLNNGNVISGTTLPFQYNYSTYANGNLYINLYDNQVDVVKYYDANTMNYKGEFPQYFHPCQLSTGVNLVYVNSEIVFRNLSGAEIYHIPIPFTYAGNDLIYVDANNHVFYQ